MRMKLSWTPLTLAALALLALAASPTEAQTGKLTGVVTDASTGNPLPGVQVFVEGTGRGALTQENGRYFLVNLTPGTYTVVAQLIGYATVRKENVLIAIDITRTLDFQMPSQAVAVEEIVVEAERVPLVEVRQTGSANAITAESIEALPVTNIQGVLALQSGLLEVPYNTDVIAFSEQRRTGTSPIRIRGGRGGETLTLIDGIPVNNFVFGNVALDVTNEAVQQVSVKRGGFDPEYGNALSGIIDIATKEGGRELTGAIDYQTSSIAGALGSDADDLRSFDFLEGFLSGPVPGTDGKLRYMVAGRQESGADRVLQFDDDVYNPFSPDTGRFTYSLDLYPGWRALGYNDQRDLFIKGTYYFTPARKLNVSFVDYERVLQRFDFDWGFTGFDAAAQCEQVYGNEENVEDVCGNYYDADRAAQDGRSLGFRRYQFLSPASISLDRQLYTAKWDHTIGRTAYKFTVGRLDQSRETCNYFSGVCMGARIADTNFNGRFVTPGVTANHPAEGTEGVSGGETLSTDVARFDIASQVSDNHNLKFGLYLERHDVVFDEFQDVGLNNIFIIGSHYEAEPWNAAAYIQDKIEYDFLTLSLGFRFDYGKAGGLFFDNPLDPTNGTTAFDVCENPEAFGETRARFPSLAACTDDRALLQEAASIAFQDDMAEAPLRKQFSPRLGLSFPVTDGASLYFNFGRYSQNPLLNNIYQGTAIGTQYEGTPQGPAFFNSVSSVFVGNPNLLTERTTSYEIGFVSEFLEDFAVTGVVFSKDQFGLTGVRSGGFRADGSGVFDPGVTYGTNAPRYQILLNQDFQTVRGFEVGLKRRLSGYWSFDTNYSFSQARTNAAPPELEFQKVQEEGDVIAFEEIRSEVDRAHVFNGSLIFRVGQDAPDIPFGEALRNGRLSFTMRASSGLPYTPQLDWTGGTTSRLDRNSGTSPATSQIDMLVSKDFNWANLRYGTFVRVQNLLDQQNCTQVFASTGNCESGASAQARLRSGNFTGESEGTTFFDRPHYFGQRRTINAGIRVSF